MSEKIILTRKMLHSAGTWKGNGFNKKQLAALGIGWPPKRGWLKNLVGREVTLEQWEEFTCMSSQRGVGKTVATKIERIADLVKDGLQGSSEDLEFLYELRDMFQRLRDSEYHALKDRRW